MQMIDAELQRQGRCSREGVLSMNATVEQTLISKIRMLTPQQVAEVEDFLEFLAAKSRKYAAINRLLAIAPALEAAGVPPMNEDEIAEEVRAARAEPAGRRRLARQQRRRRRRLRLVPDECGDLRAAVARRPASAAGHAAAPEPAAVRQRCAAGGTGRCAHAAVAGRATGRDRQAGRRCAEGLRLGTRPFDPPIPRRIARRVLNTPRRSAAARPSSSTAWSAPPR